MSAPNPATSAAKVCIRCGVDCATRPRTKDLQGRYTCRDCFDAAQKQAAPAPPAPPVVTIVSADPDALAAAAALPAPAPVGGDATDDASPALLDALLADAVQAQAKVASAPCPGCGHPLAADAALCTGCGYNPRTGAAVQTRKVEVEAPRPSIPRSERQRARDFEAREAERIEQMEFIKPLVLIALAVPGVCYFLTINKNHVALTVPKYLGVYILSIIITAALYALFCLVKLGFRDSLALGAIRLAAVVAACDLVRIPILLFGGMDAFSQGALGLVLPFAMCIGLLYYFLDLDILDAIILGIAMTATLLGAGFVITAAMGA